MTSTPPAEAEAEHPPADDEPSRPIVRLTKESTAKYRQEQAKLFAELIAQPGAYISPLSDESVQGYRTDEDARRNGLVEIKELVTDQLRTAGIPCCLAAEAALIYYGTGRMLHVFGPLFSLQRAQRIAADLCLAGLDCLRPFRST